MGGRSGEGVGLGGGGQGGCYRRIEVFGKIHKKNSGGGSGGGSGWWGSAMLGVGGDVGYG